MPLSPLGNYIQMTNASAHFFPVDALHELGELMTKVGPANGRSTVNAAYVYFGQFIAHDLTRLHRGDDNPNPTHQAKLPELKLDRSPRFDLDSVYGKGWKDKKLAVCKNTGKLFLGETKAVSNETTRVAIQSFPAEFDDLPRDKYLKAKVPDCRNDENLFVAQLHVLFIKLHNIIADEISSQFPCHPRRVFEDARSQVINIYQQIIVNDFLPVLMDEEVLKFVWDNPDLNLFEVDDETRSMPIEFSVAAFRFGHSMVLNQYPQGRRTDKIFIQELFSFTGESPEPFGGHGGLPADRVVDWRKMLKGPGTKGALLDPVVFRAAVPVREGQISNLATRNLYRGNEVGLPSAQGLIKALVDRTPSLAAVIEPIDTKDFTILDKFKDQTFTEYLREHTPLWYYILEEAQGPDYDENGGTKLGKLGSLIVAATMIQILKSMPSSVLNLGVLSHTLSIASDKPFTLETLVELVQPEINGA